MGKSDGKCKEKVTGPELERRLKEENCVRVQKMYEKLNNITQNRLHLTGYELMGLEAQYMTNLTQPIDDSIDLSGIVICKDEVQTIVSCIGSLKPHVGEIVVVDTGSTDGTYETLKEISDIRLEQKEITPFNFATAKNYALDMGKKNSAFVLDADETIRQVPERFKPVNGAVFHILLKDLMTREQARIPRIFPNYKDYRYDKEVHVELSCPADAQHIPYPGFEIYHHGYLVKEKARNREQRNADFLEKIEQQKLNGFPEFFRHAKLCVTNGAWDRMLPMWEDGHMLFKLLPQEVQKLNSAYLLFPALRAVSIRDYQCWHVFEHFDLMGHTIDNSFLEFAKEYDKGNFEIAIEYADDYFKFITTEMDQPFAASVTIGYEEEVRLKVNLAKYWLEKQNGS